MFNILILEYLWAFVSIALRRPKLYTLFHEFFFGKKTLLFGICTCKWHSSKILIHLNQFLVLMYITLLCFCHLHQLQLCEFYLHVFFFFFPILNSSRNVCESYFSCTINFFADLWSKWVWFLCKTLGDYNNGTNEPKFVSCFWWIFSKILRTWDIQTLHPKGHNIFSISNLLNLSNSSWKMGKKPKIYSLECKWHVELFLY